MRLGFVSAILPDLSLREVLEVAAGRYECVEVMCWPVGKADRRYAGVTHIDVTDLSPDRVGEITAAVRETGVGISALGYYPNPLAPDPEEAARTVAHLRLVIQAAAALGVPAVNSFAGRDWTASLEQNWPRFADTWGPLVALADECGVRIGIENCPMLFSADEWPGGKNLAVSPAVWRRMFGLIPSPNFGLNFDPSHFVWQHMDYLKPLREFRDRLFHVHAKDVRVDRGRLDEVGILALPKEYHVPKLPGLGDVDWGAFFGVLGDIGYRGPVCVEVEDRAFEGSLDLRKASLRQSATYLRNFIPTPA